MSKGNQNFVDDRRSQPISEKTAKYDLWMFVLGGINLIGLGGFLLWSCFAPLSEGVTTTGHIIADSETQTVQHLEGGIISALNVKEGDLVSKGDILIELDTTSSEAHRAQVVLQHDTALIGIERIKTLLNEGANISIKELKLLSPDPVANAIFTQQIALFESQRYARQQEREVLTTRKNSLNISIIGREREIRLVQVSRDEIDKEIEVLEALVEQQLARRDELHRLVRQQSTFDVELSQLRAQIEDLRNQILEADQQFRHSHAAFEETLSLELIEANTTLSRSQQELKALEDTLTRTYVTAPVTGEVLNLQFATIGGVVRPGQPILEIVPKSTGTWATLRIQPNDREAVYAGLDVKARLAAFKSWQSPTVIGKVSTISADLKTFPETGLSYYEARVEFDTGNFNDHKIDFIVPGMPVEAFILSGDERTFMHYAIEPITAHFSKGLSGG